MEAQKPIVTRGTKMTCGDEVLTVAAILRTGVECVCDDYAMVVVPFRRVELAAVETTQEVV